MFSPAGSPFRKTDNKPELLEQCDWPVEMQGALEIGIWPSPGSVQRWLPAEASFHLRSNWPFNNQELSNHSPVQNSSVASHCLLNRGPIHFALPGISPGFLALKSLHLKKPISLGQTKMVVLPTKPRLLRVASSPFTISSPPRLTSHYMNSTLSYTHPSPPGLTSHHHHLHFIL